LRCGGLYRRAQLLGLLAADVEAVLPDVEVTWLEGAGVDGAREGGGAGGGDGVVLQLDELEISP
jgi:hypothetical protein